MVFDGELEGVCQLRGSLRLDDLRSMIDAVIRDAVVASLSLLVRKRTTYLRDGVPFTGYSEYVIWALLKGWCLNFFYVFYVQSSIQKCRISKTGKL